MKKLRDGFTLIEMMVVVVVIAILMAGTFRLMKTVDLKNKEAQTKTRLQKLQNVLSAFYSEYGSYPPVAEFCSPDPYVEHYDPFDSYQSERPASGLTAQNATYAARCQPVDYLYPPPQKWDQGINEMYRKKKAQSANGIANSIRNRNNPNWGDSDGTRAFRFGLLSFLLPRFTLMGGNSNGNLSGNDSPHTDFLRSIQWRKNNPGTDREIYEREQLVVARWLPNFERFPLNGVGNIMGVTTGTSGDDNMRQMKVVTDPQTGQKIVLMHAKIYDGWDREFFYYSAPPYQSYRIWSAGPDGITFPPWATPKNNEDSKRVEKWTADDIVLFDR